MSGKRAFLDLLKQEGVEIMFGNPGTTELPLMDAFAVEHDIRYVLGLQEAALMAMADGYAQASGNLAVLNLHVAPGLGNAMGMLYDAAKANRRSSSPPASRTSTISPPNRCFLRTCRRWRGRSSNGPPRCIASPICRARASRRQDRAGAAHRAGVPVAARRHSQGEADLDLMAPTRVAPRLRGDAAALAVAAEMLATADAR